MRCVNVAAAHHGASRDIVIRVNRAVDEDLIFFIQLSCSECDAPQKGYFFFSSGRMLDRYMLKIGVWVSLISTVLDCRFAGRL